MKTTQFTRGILAAAVLGAMGAYAQSTDTPTAKQQANKAAQSNTTTSAPSGTGANTAANTASKPLCSSLNHPNAGKLADKSTGMAKENSASAVHMDCIPDSQAAASGAVAGSGTANTGSATEANSAVTGSSSTLNPTIDARGRSTVTIDNTTSTGDQSLSNGTTTSTGDQSLKSSTSATTGTDGAVKGKKKSDTGTTTTK